ncbi:hypothetical protein Musp01_07990 [Muricauda sp. NBRC 101325]|nr:hypothetical protein Musp01_07990 [Muricauda sp. NBRC 101325]
MRLLLFIFTLSVLSSKAQVVNQEILEEGYDIVNLVLNDINAENFIFYDENYTFGLNSGFKAYIYWYMQYLETGKIVPLASKDIEWVLKSGDIGFIARNIEYKTVKTRWDKTQIENPNLIYASDRPDLVALMNPPRPLRVHLSKPYLNKDNTKAVIFRVIGGNGFLILAKKVDGKWQLCGEIEYMFS